MPKNLKQKKKARLLHRRLRDIPQECFQNDFDRLPAQMSTPVEVHEVPREIRSQEASLHVAHSNVPFGDSGPTTYLTQVLEEGNRGEVNEPGFDQEIDNQYVNGSRSSRALYLQVPETSSRSPYLAAQHGVQVGDMVRLTIPDTPVSAAGTSESLSWVYQDSPATNYSLPTHMGIGQLPISDYVGGDPFMTNEFGLQPTSPCSSSPYPQRVAENQVQHNSMGEPSNSRSIATLTNSSNLDPRIIGHWYGESESGNGSGPNGNPH